MDYALDADQESYRQSVRKFATTVLAPHYQSDDKAARFRRQLATDMARMGPTGLRIPEEHGGPAGPRRGGEVPPAATAGGANAAQGWRAPGSSAAHRGRPQVARAAARPPQPPEAMSTSRRPALARRPAPHRRP